MRALHLKQIGEVWYYQRRRPKTYEDIEQTSLIRFSLKTKDFNQAKILATQHSIELELQWASAKERGVSIASNDATKRFTAAKAIVNDLNLDYRPARELTDEELMERLRQLITGNHTQPEQQAVLGLIDAPSLSLSQAFDRFWDHIQDEWMVLSKDQVRVKKNIYLKSVRSFETAVGQMPFHDIKRKHALIFRAWWLKRLKRKGLTPHTANREINSLRRLMTVNYDIDSIERSNPFHRVRLKDTEERQRQPFTTEFIKETLLAPQALSGLKPEMQILVRMLVNTGARPSELLGLEKSDIDLNAPVPFIHIRTNKIHALKTPHSVRQIPLVGVSLKAVQELVALGGWGKWEGKNMYATGVINKYLRDKKILTEKNRSLYSLRHWFQDQLTKNDVVDRAQAQLMGHKFHRPKYGFGKDLSELKIIIEKFAL